MISHNPKFQRFNPDKPTKAIIFDIQKKYEEFYEMIKVNCNFNDEHKIALQHLQESCMWFTRGIAQSFHYKTQMKNIVNKTPTETDTLKTKIIIKKSKMGQRNDFEKND